MKGLFFVDETGNFEKAGTSVSMSGVFFPDQGLLSQKAFVGRVLQGAAAAAPVPLHAGRSFEPARFALGLLAATEDGRLHESISRTDEVNAALARASKELRVAADDLSRGRLPPNTALHSLARFVGSVRGERELESSAGLLGWCVGTRLSESTTLHRAQQTAYRLGGHWLETCPTALAAGIVAIHRGEEPCDSDIQTLVEHANGSATTRDDFARMAQIARNSRGVLQRVLKVFLSGERSAPFWVGTGETAPGSENGPLVAAPRWLSMFELLLERTARLAKAKGITEIEVLALCPRAVAIEAEQTGRHATDLYRIAARAAEVRAGAAGVLFQIRIAPWWKRHAPGDARYVIADVAASGAGCSVRKVAGWRGAKVLLQSEGIGAAESRSQSGIPLPHAAAVGAAAAWLDTHPQPGSVPPREPCHRQWAWDQAEAWHKEAP